MRLMETQELGAHDAGQQGCLRCLMPAWEGLGSQTVGGVHAYMSVCGCRESHGGRPRCLAGGGKQGSFSLDGESVMQHVRGC